MPHAYEYDETNASHWHERAQDATHKQAFDHVLKCILPVEGKACLDIACGTGIFLADLARNGAVAIGLDASPTILSMGEQYLTQQGLRVIKRASPLELKVDSSYNGTVQLVQGDMYSFSRSGLPPCDTVTLTFPYFGFDAKDLILLDRINRAFLHAIPSTMARNGHTRRAEMAHEIFVKGRELLKERGPWGMPVYTLGADLPTNFFDISERGQANVDLYLKALLHSNWPPISQLAILCANHRLVFEEAHSTLKNGGRFVLATYGGKSVYQLSPDWDDEAFCIDAFLGEKGPLRNFSPVKTVFIPLDIDMAKEQHEVEDTNTAPDDYSNGIYLVDVRVDK